MTDELGKITPRKVPASEAIPGNPEHAKMIAKAKRTAGKGDAKWSENVRTGIWGPVLFGIIILGLFAAAVIYWASSSSLAGAALVPELFN